MMTSPPESPDPGKPSPDTEVDAATVAADDAIVGIAFRWSLIAIVAIGLVVAAVVLLRGGEEPETIIERDPIDPVEVLANQDDTRRDVVFTDVTAAAGIDFVHENGARDGKLLPETMGGGVAFFDYDNDGDQDLFFVNGTMWPGEPGPAATHRLYANDGNGSFTDVTVAAGLNVSSYGMGPAADDIDGDGDLDLFIAGVNGDRMYRNDDGVFVDVSSSCGIDDGPGHWSSSAGFFDADGDGDRDLWVCRYIQWSPEIDAANMYSLDGVNRSYGPPTSFRGDHNVLYRNDGGLFTDVSEAAGLHVVNEATGEPVGKSLAVAFPDLDADGDLDVIVASDTTRNFLFRNRGDATFEEVGIDAGVAFNSGGAPTGAMGIDVAHFDGRDRVGVGIGNFANEPTSFFVQQPGRPWQFADMAASEGIGSPSRLRLSFGLVFVDYDLDGRPDLMQANGHLDDEITSVQASQTYRQPTQLFWNCGDDSKRCYAEVPGDTTGDLATPIVGRGLAFADIDGDGDQDVVLTQTGGAPTLLRNDQDLDRHWIRVRLVGPVGNPTGSGASIRLEHDGHKQRAVVMPTRSYLSQVEPVMTFGLGESDSIDAMSIRWPDGTTQTIASDDLATVDREMTIQYVPDRSAQSKSSSTG